MFYTEDFHRKFLNFTCKYLRVTMLRLPRDSEVTVELCCTLEHEYLIDISDMHNSTLKQQLAIWYVHPHILYIQTNPITSYPHANSVHLSTTIKLPSYISQINNSYYSGHPACKKTGTTTGFIHNVECNNLVRLKVNRCNRYFSTNITYFFRSSQKMRIFHNGQGVCIFLQHVCQQ